MKKVFLYSFGLVLALGMIACSSDTATKEVATASTAATAETSTSTPVPTTNPNDNKPDYIRRAEELPRTSVEFGSDEFDFGQVKQGEKVYHKYMFTNTGSEDLVITYIRTSCGCTTPEYSKEPVKPGAEGYVDVEFDSSGKKDTQMKTITVFGNFEGQPNRALKLKGEVVTE